MRDLAKPFRTAARTLALLTLAGSAALWGQDLRQEEEKDYFKKWLEEEVPYIITEEERAVFVSLGTPAEQERFIEQFWKRRDPDPATEANEFKQEYYRRIAYANEHFHSGVAGWRTDRGKIYIMYGQPDEVSGKPEGGVYYRPAWEGGGATSVFPFIVWRYRYLEGVGSDVEIEFVDPHQSGEFRLARDAEEKDALLYIPNAGSTLSEAAGVTSKRDRILTRHLADQKLKEGNPFYVNRLKDQPFERLLQRALLDRPQKIRYTDLETVVRTRTTYSSLPFRFGIHYLFVSAREVLAPLAVQVRNRDLKFVTTANGGQQAKVQIYGEVWNVRKEMIFQFEDELEVSLRPEDGERALRRRSIFQRLIPMQPGRHIVKLVIKDAHSGQLSTADELVVVSSFSPSRLASSSLIPADAIQPGTDPESMFWLGGLKVIPNLDHAYSRNDHIFTYFQLYNLAVDQQSLLPQLSIERLAKGTTGEEVEVGGALQLQMLGDGTLAVADAVPASKLAPGTYSLRYRIRDAITGQEITVESPRLQIVSGEEPALR